MPLRLLGQQEDHPFPIGDGPDATVLTVRKVPHGVSERMTREHTKNGRFDAQSFSEALWEHVLQGWTNLFDASGKPIPSEPARRVKWTEKGEEREVSLAYLVSRGFTETLSRAILDEAKSPEFAYHEALGNSSRSSAIGGPGTSKDATPSPTSAPESPAKSPEPTSTPS